MVDEGIPTLEVATLRRVSAGDLAGSTAEHPVSQKACGQLEKSCLEHSACKGCASRLDS